MVNQNNDFQTVADFDVIEFAKSVLNEVEQIRSYDFSQNDDGTATKNHKPIESRVNAFFRIIGLPMIVSVEKKDEEAPGKDLSGEKVLTPGFYGGKYIAYNLSNSDTDEEVFNELLDREFNLLDRENKIGTEEMNNSMSKALKTAIPLVPTLEGVMDITGNIISGNIATGNQRKVFKRLFPLITSYIKVSPVKNETARPFLQYTRDQLPDSQTILPKPFIENVIRIRLVTAANAENSAGKMKSDDIKAGLKAAIGDDVYNELSSETDYILSSAEAGGMVENLILRRLISALPQLAKKWYELQNKQETLKQDASYTISIQTSSAQGSPFGKRTDISANITLDPNSKYGLQLQSLQKKLAREQALQMLLPSDDTISDNSNTTKNTSLVSLITPFAKLLSPDLEKTQKDIKDIEDKIKKQGQQMEKLRLELEMMTGEFTGLSIIDVVAVIIALFALDKQDLIALLDTDTKTEMKKDKVLETAIKDLGNPDGIAATQEAIANLEKTVKWVFDLLNGLIKSNFDRSIRSKSVRNPNRAILKQKIYSQEGD